MHSIHTPFPPLVAEHDVKEREEKERVDVESTLPPLMYNAPPLDVAVQEVNVMEERESLCPDVRVTEIAPPFSDEHDLNVAPLILCPLLIELNSNTPPFPDSSLMSVKVFVPLSMRDPEFTDISALLYVE